MNEQTIIKKVFKNGLVALAVVGTVVGGSYLLSRESNPANYGPIYDEFGRARVCNVSNSDKTFEDDFIISDFTKTTRNEALFYREIKRLNNVEDLESLYGRVSVKIPCLIDQMQV